MIDKILDGYFEGRWIKWLIPFVAGVLICTCKGG